MAKDIKAIQCPHCGSIYKTEVKPDFYQCQNCGTEYYLDSDDVNIYHHGVQPAQSSYPPGNTKAPVYILIIAIACIAIVYVLLMVFNKNNTVTSNSYVMQTPRLGFASFVYTNSETGDPVHLRLATDYLSKGNNGQSYQVHAMYYNAATGHLIQDLKMFDGQQQHNSYRFDFCNFGNKLIYAICDDVTLFQLDTRDNKLIDVTQALFKNFPQLSSGIAKFEPGYSGDVLKILNNEGNTYYYFPLTRQMVADYDKMQAIWNEQHKSRRFVFDYVDQGYDVTKKKHLLELKYFDESRQTLQKDLTPGRNYFNPQIIYQDTDNLIIATHITVADESPVTLEAIDVETGKIKWALPPDKYYLYSSSKCKQGFAVEYRKDADDDYVHGALVISPAGKLIHNFKLGRTE